MGVEKQNSNESSEKQINKPKKTEQETQKAVENVKQNISKAKEAHKSGDIETQVGPILEKFGISEKRVDTIINRLSKLNDKSREALINQIKSGNKDLAIKIIDRLAPEGNVNKEINQNKTEIKALIKGFFNFGKNKSNFFQKKIGQLQKYYYNTKQVRENLYLHYYNYGKLE
ncbi:hypothetical protein BKN14_01745 [Candidatus Gracilibacteria bacterium HOT-871]|nr:hypothetical protein BKN14_01745 [Candidatus Gracilibacteria bacterium HOT-871]